jgi:hypothetical protein
LRAVPLSLSITRKTAHALRRRRHQFVHGELAIAVFVERLKRGGRVGDFVRVNDTIVICVERVNHRRDRLSASTHPWPAGATGVARPTRATLPVRILRARRTLIVRLIAGVLRNDDPGRRTERDHGENCFGCGFHVAAFLLFLFVVVLRPPARRSRVLKNCFFSKMNF